MMKLKYLTAVLALTTLSASAVDVESGKAVSHGSTLEWTIDGVPKIHWEAKSYTAALGKIDLSKFAAANSGSIDIVDPKPLFSLAMAKVGGAKELWNVPKIAYLDNAGKALTMTWDNSAQEGTLTVPGKMQASSKAFNVEVKLKPVSLARIVNTTEQTYLDVPVHLDKAKQALFTGLACDDCTLPTLTNNEALAPDLKARIDLLDVTALQADSKQGSAKANLNKSNLGEAADDAALLVEDSDKQYTVADSKVMLGAGLGLNAGKVTFTSTQGFEAGQWQAPITVVVSGL